MISVSEALETIFAIAPEMGVEHVPLRQAAGRILAQPVTARRDQPPFAASAMDGYALNSLEADVHAQFKVIGESAAGHRFEGRCGAGTCVRIFTGAPMPEGCDRVIIQENTQRQGDVMTITDAPGDSWHVRPAGADFAVGDSIDAPRHLSAADIALLAAMNIAEVPVRKRPVIALISTGDELVQPGEDPGPDQIIASNTYGLEAMLRAAGAEVRMLPIAPDDLEQIKHVFSLADGADLIVTIGGASVGDHDLVGQAFAELGMDRSFYKVRMRPGKPLMAGQLGDTAVVGLPGNPVSAMVCGHVFLRPMVNAMLGLGQMPVPRLSLRLAREMGANGDREHYLRARIDGQDVTAFESQDSALLTVLAQANGLLVRPPNDPARHAGEMVEVVPLA